MRIEKAERDVLRLRRLALRVTQAELAAVVGCSHTSISLWEDGKRSPRGPAITAWRRALDRLERRAARRVTA